MALRKGNKGSMMVESCFVLLAWTVLLTSALSAFGWAHLRVWSHFILYESLICAAEDQPLTSCKAKALANARVYVPFLHSPSVTLQKSGMGKSWSVTLRGVVLQDLVFSQSLSFLPPTRIVRW